MASLSIPEPRSERVELGARSTDVRIGAGLWPHLWAAVRARFPQAERCGVAIDERVAAAHALPPAPGDLEVLAVGLPQGEAAKTREVLGTLQDAWIGLRRDEPIVAVGGGAALDVGGFAAATVRRGLPWVAVATSVVAMADAAVGGKTAVNHPRGKNLLGAFHPPTFVLSDVRTLATLDDRDRVAGLAELYKCGRIADAALIARLRAGPPASEADWIEAVHAAVSVKARLVESDERDAGMRRLLNYGHTLGHALERVLGNARMRHGEAVAIGMDAAARLAVARGLMDESARAMQRGDLERLGL
ncbi:MAG: 3-dehydroquinate synthase, partial [Planctomycetota bacterium]|nr:3-dehydroquinate synthase [Planctomycetota bacterium]